MYVTNIGAMNSDFSSLKIIIMGTYLWNNILNNTGIFIQRFFNAIIRSLMLLIYLKKK